MNALNAFLAQSTLDEHIRRAEAHRRLAVAEKETLTPHYDAVTIRRATPDDWVAVERLAGRARDVPKGPRPLDIDILIYRDRVVDAPGLTIPHPRYRERRFVLVPMVELAPDLSDPVCGLTMSQLLDLCPDEGEVRRQGDPLL